MGIVYRAKQFWRTLNFTYVPAFNDQNIAANILPPDLLALYEQMPPVEKAHSSTICQQMMLQGETNTDLLTAALLHDVGKSLYPLRLWERVWGVIAHTIIPAQARRWGQMPVEDGADYNGQPDWASTWHRALIIADNHPAWGAEMASQAGASEVTVRLIRYHQVVDDTLRCDMSDREVELLVKLQRLDGAN